MSFNLFKKCCLSMIMVSTLSAASGDTLPCKVKLEFGSNDKGSIANYTLTLQLKNTTGRIISGASILYLNSEHEQLGNTLLDCTNQQAKASDGIKPGSYGQCVSILQRVDGAFMESFGSKKWTQIVNTQLASLNAVAHCKVLGFAY